VQTFTMPSWVQEVALARKGRAHPFESIDPAKTALVVIDLQNAFMLPGVAHSPCVQAQDIVPNVNRLARTVRSTGGAVVWIQTEYTDETLTSWSTYYEALSPARRAKRREALSRGGKGFELWDGLDVQPQDLKVIKMRFSALIRGSSNLEQVLRDRGLDTVLITGTTTDVCCESTARDASMLNFRTIMVSDGTAASRDELHNASLCAFYLNFGDVMSTDMLVDSLSRHAKKAALAAAS